MISRKRRLRVAPISLKPSVPSIAFFFRLKMNLSMPILINVLSFKSRQRTSVKKKLVYELLENHAGENILIIGQFISQLEKLARSLGLPIITGKTS